MYSYSHYYIMDHVLAIKPVNVYTYHGSHLSLPFFFSKTAAKVADAIAGFSEIMTWHFFTPFRPSICSVTSTYLALETWIVLHACILVLPQASIALSRQGKLCRSYFAPSDVFCQTGTPCLFCCPVSKHTKPTRDRRMFVPLLRSQSLYSFTSAFSKYNFKRVAGEKKKEEGSRHTKFRATKMFIRGHFRPVK